MSAYYEQDESDESVAELLENIESDEAAGWDDSEERQRNRLRPFRPKVPTGRGLYKERPNGNTVTQVQLQAAMARVGEQIKTSSDATKALSARVNTLTTRLDAEAAARKKETFAVKKESQSGRMMSILPFLLMQPPKLTSFTPTTSGALVADNSVRVSNATYASQDMMLPLILMMSGGGLGGGGGSTGSDDTMMLLLAVMMMNPQKP